MVKAAKVAESSKDESSKSKFIQFNYYYQSLSLS